MKTNILIGSVPLSTNRMPLPPVYSIPRYSNEVSQQGVQSSNPAPTVPLQMISKRLFSNQINFLSNGIAL